jgi:ketosteroid isomerase-like protein
MKSSFATYRTIRIVGLVAAVFVALSFAGQALAADAKAQITELDQKCANAPTIDELMACYDNSDDLVVYDLTTPREFDGTKAVRADFQNFFDYYKNFKIQFVTLHVVSDGKLGVANSIQHMTATEKSGKPFEMTFRVTDVWRKEKDGWKMIEQHISVPVDMASGKADMQSKP